MRRKLAGLILGTAIVGIVMAPAAGAQTCNGQEITFLCPPWNYGSVCVGGPNGVSADLSDCVRPD